MATMALLNEKVEAESGQRDWPRGNCGRELPLDFGGNNCVLSDGERRMIAMQSPVRVAEPSRAKLS